MNLYSEDPTVKSTTEKQHKRRYRLTHGVNCFTAAVVSQAQETEHFHYENVPAERSRYDIRREVSEYQNQQVAHSETKNRTARVRSVAAVNETIEALLNLFENSDRLLFLRFLHQKDCCLKSEYQKILKLKLALINYLATKGLRITFGKSSAAYVHPIEATDLEPYRALLNRLKEDVLIIRCAFDKFCHMTGDSDRRNLFIFVNFEPLSDLADFLGKLISDFKSQARASGSLYKFTEV